ncbi:MAG TPA: class I adenylate-forming enzyme family protein [Stellaceae bacterium]|nr:class I adenylate-forming enzyme family protein [Stellaceae bacterium]
MIGVIPWSSALKTQADQFGDLVCVSDGVRDLTYRELAGRAAGLAARLLADGVKPGEPLATFLRNGIPAVWASYGVKLSGAAEVPLNPALTEDERRYCVSLANVKRVVTIAAEAPFFRSLGCEVLAIEALSESLGDPAVIPSVEARAWGRILFTSGTTGRPNAIVHTHEMNWIANLLQRASLPITPAPGTRVLLMTPFTHGASLITFAFLDHGAGVLLLDGVDLPSVERALDGGIDHIFAPPTVLAKLVSAFEGRRFPAVRVVFCGTSTLTPALYQKTRAIFGPSVRVTYGKTEVVNPITILPQAATDRYYRAAAAGEGACVGWPGAGVEIEIRRAEGGLCTEDEVGEVYLRAAHMLAGHIDQEGFHAHPPHGFHATGDLGRRDLEGRLHLVGRTADVIKSGGYKIYPEEIERVLAGIAGAIAVTTVPSEYWGEVIVAVAENAPGDWESAARAAATSLAKYKWPRAYVTLDALPRNPQGKVPRARVRALVLDRYALVDGPRPSLVPRSQ